MTGRSESAPRVAAADWDSLDDLAMEGTAPIPARWRLLRGGPLGRDGGRRARWRRRITRRVLAAAFVGVAALLALRTLAPPAPASRSVVVVAHDVPAGATLTSADLEVRRYAEQLTPATGGPSLASLVGRIAAGPLQAGEVVTQSRLLGPGLLTALPAGSVAVQVTTPTTDALVEPGRRVDAYVAGATEPAASGALVLAVLPAGAADALGEAPHTSVVLAVPDGSAGRLVPGEGSPSGSSVDVVLAVR